MSPTIPLLSLQDPPSAFLSALSTTGFLHLQLSPHGPVSPSLVARQFAVSSHLYDTVPLAEREKCSRDGDPDYNGHSGVGSTYLNREGGQQKADWKEGFGYGRFKEGGDWSQRLPVGMEGEREEMGRFADGCYELMLSVLDKLSLAFELPESYFRDRHRHQGANSVTLLNYPPPPSGYSLDAQDIRAGAHKDWGSVTLLFQEEGGQPGLEVFLPDASHSQDGVRLLSEVDTTKGAWHPAPIIPGSVLINLGLMMEAWTAGACVATLHRVIFPPTLMPKPRRSIAYFGTPDPEVVLQPVAKGGVTASSGVAPKVQDFFNARSAAAEVPLAERKILAQENIVAVEAAA